MLYLDRPSDPGQGKLESGKQTELTIKKFKDGCLTYKPSNAHSLSSTTVQYQPEMVRVRSGFGLGFTHLIRANIIPSNKCSSRRPKRT